MFPRKCDEAVSFFYQKSEHIEASKQQAWSDFQAQNFRGAKVAFEQWRELEPQSATAWFGVAFCGFMLSVHENVDQNKIIATYVPMYERAISLHESSKE